LTTESLSALTRAALTVEGLAALTLAALTAEGLAALTLAALTAKGLAVLTLGGEMLDLGDVCLMKGLLIGALDFNTVYGAMWGRVLEKVGLAVPIVLAAAESTGLDLGGATDMGGGEIKPKCLGVLTSSGD
nr:hypothetical protein [Tanacetum cinerariifolium]